MKHAKISKDGQITHQFILPEDELNRVIQHHETAGEFNSQTHTYEIVDVTADLEAATERQLKMEKGRMAREACQQVLDLISGENLDKELSMEQITTMQNTFGPIEAALKSARPSMAKGMIAQVQPDGVLVTQDLKDAALDILSEY